MLESDPITEQLINLARKTKYGLDAFLSETIEETIIDGTAIRLRNFHLDLDGLGLPRTRDLHKSLAQFLLDYAIPRTKILEAYEEFSHSKSSAKILELSDQARSLFTQVTKTGECGELLLFAICEQILSLPLVISKMNLKTDTEIHFHGADGVYAGLNENNKLVLFWGESKIYSDRSQAAEDCYSSMAKLLIPQAGDPDEQDRDLELLRDYSDLGDPELTKQFQEWLQKDNPAFNDVDFGGVCLIGFDEKEYPNKPKIKDSKALHNAISKKISSYNKTISHYTEKHSVSSFQLISVCIPIPSAEDFRKQFLEIVLKKKEDSNS